MLPLVISHNFEIYENVNFVSKSDDIYSELKTQRYKLNFTQVTPINLFFGLNKGVLFIKKMLQPGTYLLTINKQYKAYY